MSIVKTITNDYEFAEWVKNSDSYSNNFSFEGAKMVQEYYEQLSDDLGESIEFDPIAWCVEWSEYNSFQEAYQDIDGQETLTDEEAEAWFFDRTTTLVTDNNHVLVQEF